MLINILNIILFFFYRRRLVSLNSRFNIFLLLKKMSLMTASTAPTSISSSSGSSNINWGSHFIKGFEEIKGGAFKSGKIYYTSYKDEIFEARVIMNQAQEFIFLYRRVAGKFYPEFIDSDEFVVNQEGKWLSHFRVQACQFILIVNASKRHALGSFVTGQNILYGATEDAESTIASYVGQQNAWIISEYCAPEKYRNMDKDMIINLNRNPSDRSITLNSKILADPIVLD